MRSPFRDPPSRRDWRHSSTWGQGWLRHWRGDLAGGLTTAVVALPLAMAFGVTSGAGAIAGLYGAIVLGFLAAPLGGTAAQVSGPTGPMTVIMAGIITAMVTRYGPESGLAMAFTVALVAGALQVAHCIVTWVTCVWLLHQCLAQGGGHAERCCGWEA